MFDTQHSSTATARDSHLTVCLSHSNQNKDKPGILQGANLSGVHTGMRTERVPARLLEQIHRPGRLSWDPRHAATPI